MAAAYRTFNPDVNALVPMQQHIIVYYLAGQQTAQQALDERGKETISTDRPYLSDYRMAVRAGEHPFAISPRVGFDR
ncbi:MAG: hypothetical protein EXR01_01525 [Acetobacteraceae bacterium]|nr:hypothetical protein [Acetobacteraceae bacterium]